MRDQKVRLPWSVLTRVESAFAKFNFLQKVRLPVGQKSRAPPPPHITMLLLNCPCADGPRNLKKFPKVFATCAQH